MNLLPVRHDLSKLSVNNGKNVIKTLFAYKYHIVVVSEWASVVFLPENEPICKETEERECCQQGDCCDARDGNESLSLLRVKGPDIFMGT